MKIVFLVALFLLTACGNQTQATSFIGCNDEAKEKALFAIDLAKKQWPDIDQILDELTVVCYDEAPRNNMECVFDWYGIGIYRPGTLQVEAEYIGECLIEKSQHFNIWQKTSYVETCSDHAVSCGWDDSVINTVLEPFWVIYPQDNNES